MAHAQSLDLTAAPTRHPDSARMGPVSLSAGLVELCSRDITANDRARAALHLLDWSGCALAGTRQPAANALAAWVRDQAAAGNACALGLGPAGAEQAAFFNGGLGNLLEMDDLHRASILHAGDVVVPAALAQAQQIGASGAALLDAIVVGYEVALRIGRAVARNGYSAWYNSATCGVFGAAMAAARLRGLCKSACLDALGQAGMQASGVWQCRLENTDSKQLATAHAARAGLTSAALAATGFRGAHAILEGPLGFFATYYPSAAQSLVLSQADAPWLLHEVSFKPWPACRHTHPAIHLALSLRGQIDPARIIAVEVATSAAALSFCRNPLPSTDHEARFSFEHCVAVTLLRGAPGLKDFEENARNDPKISQLRNNVTVREDQALTAAFPDAIGAAICVTHADGPPVQLATQHAPGDPELPMSPEQIVAKFCANAACAGASATTAAAISDTIRALPDSADLSRLGELLISLACIPETSTPRTGDANG